MNSNGFSAADMSTAAANGHAEGYQAGYADAVKAMDHIGDANKMVPDKSLSPLSRIADSFGVTGTWDQIADAVIARSTPAAPVVDVATLRALSDRWANDRSYTGSPVDDIRALIEQPTMSTPAAPWIDLRELAELLRIWLCNFDSGVRPDDDNEPEEAALWDRIERIRQQAIDASPKGGSEPVVTLTIGEAGGEGTQAYFLDRIRDTEAFGKLQPGTYQLAVCYMQATSAEVGA